MNKLVLIADDNPNDLFLLRHAFERTGLASQIVEVSDGQQAINYLSGEAPYADRIQNPVPDLLILDLQMPKLNGWDVLQWLRGRAELSHLHVAVLSSSSLEADQAQARALGAHDYQVKPSDFTSWMRLARDFQTKWLSGALALAR
ncbi:MAG TPA: response regulator [Candidatus Binatia bacterium]|jgi:CheY-like chemotaxis protein|nr:response regulator [Candidatus Binatia bacterium]